MQIVSRVRRNGCNSHLQSVNSAKPTQEEEEEEEVVFFRDPVTISRLVTPGDKQPGGVGSDRCKPGRSLPTCRASPAHGLSRLWVGCFLRGVLRSFPACRASPYSCHSGVVCSNDGDRHHTASMVAERDPLPGIVQQVRATFGADAVAVLSRSGEGWTVHASAGEPVPTRPSDGHEIELGADERLVLLGSAPASDDLRLLAAFAAQLTAALEKRRLEAEAAEADRLSPPKVGPSEGWRSDTTALRPRCLKACPSPMAVVVLPSASGVGLEAVTRTYRAGAAPCRRSLRGSPWRPCGPSAPAAIAMPMRAATSSIRSRPDRAGDLQVGGETGHIPDASPGMVREMGLPRTPRPHPPTAARRLPPPR